METGATPVLRTWSPSYFSIATAAGFKFAGLFAASLKFYERGQIVVCGSIVPVTFLVC
jgi:hypothetical protein